MVKVPWHAPQALTDDDRMRNARAMVDLLAAAHGVKAKHFEIRTTEKHECKCGHEDLHMEITIFSGRQ